MLHALCACVCVREGRLALLLELGCVSGARTDAGCRGACERRAVPRHGASERDWVEAHAVRAGGAAQISCGGCRGARLG